jgi:hypothetical protein
MRKVFLLTGFNNWGKTTLINDLFGKSRFAKHQLHNYAGKQFCVIPQSNDDLGEQGYINAYNQRISMLSQHGLKVDCIFSAFCPTKEPDNQSARIISAIYSGDDVFVLSILHKWCCHASLNVPEISSYYSSLGNVKVHTVSSYGSGTAKLTDLQAVIGPLL